MRSSFRSLRTIGYAAVVCLIGAWLFNSSRDRHCTEIIEPRYRLSRSELLDDVELKAGLSELGTFYASIKGDAALDPSKGVTFLVSTLVRFYELPAVGKSQKIIAKYNAGEAPYRGWALGVHRLRTSTRPAVYWRNRAGEGGWHDFEHCDLKLDTWYSLTWMVRSGDYMSLYVQELKGLNGLSGEREEAVTFVPAAGLPRFFGGYDLSDLGAVRTEAKLYLSTGRSRKEGSWGEVARVLIASSEAIPQGDPAMVKSFLDGGSPRIVGRIKSEDIALWIGASGRDESIFGREIEFSPKG